VSTFYLLSLAIVVALTRLIGEAATDFELALQGVAAEVPKSAAEVCSSDKP